MENNTSPDSNQINNKNNPTKEDIKIQLAFNYDIKIKITEKMTLAELKTEISKNYLLSEDDYEIIIGKKNINNEPNNILVLKLFEKYNSNNINIKTYKNIFDLQNQLNSYDNYLEENISLKSNEIELLKEQFENLQKDLSNI